MVELSEEAQNLLMKVQTQNQQLQELIAQKQNFDVHNAEIEEAIKEMDGKEEVYRELAGILMKSDKGKIQGELEEEKEMLSIRKKQIDTREKQLKEELETDQKKLMGFIQGGKQDDQIS
ncbi:MAG: prefoldin subunit [Candidatus Aenigmarchaeota archaeon]|nr:prefoldin subunit [Candidatus Aenigmarchaeota archaeon]